MSHGPIVWNQGIRNGKNNRENILLLYLRSYSLRDRSRGNREKAPIITNIYLLPTSTGGGPIKSVATICSGASTKYGFNAAFVNLGLAADTYATMFYKMFYVIAHFRPKVITHQLSIHCFNSLVTIVKGC